MTKFFDKNLGRIPDNIMLSELRKANGKEELKYFIPDIEDIRVGYECEVLWCCAEPRLWVPIIITEEDNMDTKSLPFGIEINWRLKDGEIRVPYLTKEQIEAEGWKHEWTGESNDILKDYNLTKFIDNQDGGIKYYLQHIMMRGKVENENMLIEYSLFKNGKEENYKSTVFDGTCKDINTFRYICKLLNIK